MISKVHQRKFIKNILKKRGIDNKETEDLLLKVPRELFNDRLYSSNLYSASRYKYYGAWELPDIEYISDIISSINTINNKHKVLLIGSGTGYLLSILSYLFEECYGIELDKTKHEICMDNLNKLGIGNAVSKVGDGLIGWDEDENFDCIIINCGIDNIPNDLVGELNEDGLILAPIGSLTAWPEEGCQNLTALTKTRDGFREEIISQVYVTPISRITT